MNSSTRTLDSISMEIFLRTPIREKATGCKGTPTAGTLNEAGTGPRMALDQHAQPHPRPNRTYRRFGERLEHALFTVTLAAMGSLYLGVLLAQSI